MYTVYVLKSLKDGRKILEEPNNSISVDDYIAARWGEKKHVGQSTPTGLK